MNTIPKFTVDTHVFRELGALLVGRDSTALVELIKNSYDADSTSVRVYGENLNNPEIGYIRITDTGNGMTEEQFRIGFLRIASRVKEEGKRRSPIFGRRYTGAKGIGRLAVHKLAAVAEVESVPRYMKGDVIHTAINARIDWDLIEEGETLDAVKDGAIVIETSEVPLESASGTTITLRRLRKKWTPQERSRFMAEVQSFEPPSFLRYEIPQTILREPLLFQVPKIRDKRPITLEQGVDAGGQTKLLFENEAFEIKLEGDFDAGETFWAPVLDASTWIIEIDASRERNGTVFFELAPTSHLLRKHPWVAQKRHFSVEHPDPQDGPFFQARIMVREGNLPSKIRSLAEQAAGIRVYMEGFRVLPYGEPKNDWLSIDSDVAANPTGLPRLSQETQLNEQIQRVEYEGQTMLPIKHYYGAIFLTQSDAPQLHMLVNREGFIPNNSYEVLVRLVRNSIDLTTRLRTAIRHDARYKIDLKPASEGSRGDNTRGGKPAKGANADHALSRAKETGRRIATLVHEASTHAAQGDIKTAAVIIQEAELASNELTNEMSVAEAQWREQENRNITEAAMLRVLASIGTQMASYIHEINTLLSMAQSIEETASRLKESREFPKVVRNELGRLVGLIGDLRRSIEKQASYLIDVVTPDARRRRTRIPLAEKFNASRRLIDPMAQRRSIQIENQIPSDLKSPPMFPAEIVTVFSNLLTNAVKAAGDSGKILAWGSQSDDGKTTIIVENTGATVTLNEAEKWFQPFESTTSEVNPSLGQGMGLGLTITRAMLEDYGAEIRFREPSPGYSTSVEIVLPK